MRDHTMSAAYQVRLPQAEEIARAIAATLPMGYDILKETCERGYPRGFDRLVATIDPNNYEEQYSQVLNTLMAQRPELIPDLLTLDEEVGALLARLTEGDEEIEWEGDGNEQDQLAELMEAAPELRPQLRALGELIGARLLCWHDATAVFRQALAAR